MTKNIDFDGLPEVYDAERVTVSIRQAFNQVQTHLEDTAPAIAQAPPSNRYPSFKTVKKVALAIPPGVYGSTSDPRVASPTAYEGGGVSSDKQSQRFRIGAGVSVYPLMRFPVRNSTWTFPLAFGTAVGRVAFGALVPGIRHDLRRIPERVTLRGSAGLRGPTGQLLQNGGDATYYPTRTSFRCDLDFIPVFGREPDDIEFQLKHLVSFSGGMFGSDDLGGVVTDASSYENPTFLREFAAEMVTTEDRFGGLLLATHWGLGTYQGSIGSATPGGGTFGAESLVAWLRNPVNTVADGMLTCALPDLGKQLFGLPIPAAPLSTYLATGLKLTLAQGTVDFVLE